MEHTMPKKKLEKGKNGTFPSNKWIRDENAYCVIHKKNGHATKDRKRLGDFMAATFAVGELARVHIEHRKHILFLKEKHRQLKIPKL